MDDTLLFPGFTSRGQIPRPVGGVGLHSLGVPKVQAVNRCCAGTWNDSLPSAVKEIIYIY